MDYVSNLCNRTSDIFNRVWKTKAIYLLLFIINIIILVKLKFFLPLLSGSTNLPDFDIYYRLSKNLITGIDPYKVDYMQTLGPPTVLSYFVPFTLSSLTIARSMATLFNIGSAILCCYILAKYFSKKVQTSIYKTSLVFNAILLSSFPLRFSLEMGQPNPVITLLISYLLTNKFLNYKVIASIVIIKTFYATILLTLIKRHKVVLISSVYFVVLILLIIIAFSNVKIVDSYLSETIMALINQKPDQSGLDYYNQSLSSTLFRVGFDQSLLFTRNIITFLTFIYLIVSQNLYAGLILSVLVSPVAWQHYFVSFFPVFVVMATKNRIKKSNIIILLIALLFWWIEIPTLHNTKISLLTGLLASHYFISGLLLVYVIINTQSRLTINKLLR